MHCPLSIRTEPKILVCLEMMGNGRLAYQGLYIFMYKIILSLMSEIIYTPNLRSARRESGAQTTDLSRLLQKFPDFVGVHGRVLESESHCTNCVCLLLSLALPTTWDPFWTKAAAFVCFSLSHSPRLGYWHSGHTDLCTWHLMKTTMLLSAISMHTLHVSCN